MNARVELDEVSRKIAAMPDGELTPEIRALLAEQGELLRAVKTGTPGLNAALAKAQGEIANAEMDRTNPAFKSSYATLASCWNACRAALSKNGLAVLQNPSCDGKSVTVQTVLLHASGEERMSLLTLPLGKYDAWGIGSAVSYAKRYALCAMVGIAAEDDDGVAAADPKNAAAKAAFDLAKATEKPPEKTRKLKVEDGPPRLTFGPDGVKNKLLSELTGKELGEMIALGEERLSASPSATWAAGVSGCLADLKKEDAVRAEKAITGAK